MRFKILRPRQPTDVRRREFASQDDLERQCPVQGDFTDETNAATAVRDDLPNAAGMPMYLGVGSGNVCVIGFVDHWATKVDPSGDIPFVLLVQAIPEDDQERSKTKKRPPFRFDLWKLPVLRPESPTKYKVEVRATDLQIPFETEADVGYVDGRLTMFMQVGATQMSITMDERVYLSLRSGRSPTEITGEIPVSDGSDKFRLSEGSPGVFRRR